MDIKRILRSFIMEQLRDNGFHESVSDDDSLIEAGIMDSLSILTTISFLDEKFGIFPSEDELDPENFDSVITICSFVERKLGERSDH
jgi:acyl carrier protein